MADWTPWESIKDSEGPIFVSSIKESKDEFSLKLTNYEIGYHIELCFEHGVDLYRYANESFSFGIIGDLAYKYNNNLEGRFFKLTDSDLLNWMSEKSNGTSDQFPLIHFCIITDEEFIDIIARYEPEVIYSIDTEISKKIIPEWTQWEPIKGLDEKYFVDELNDERSKFILKLSNSDMSKIIEIKFTSGIDTYRTTNIDFCLGITSEVEEKYKHSLDRQGRFFKMTESDFLRWIAQEIKCPLEHLPMQHFCIIGENKIVDIIARNEPEVKIIKLSSID